MFEKLITAIKNFRVSSISPDNFFDNIKDKRQPITPEQLEDLKSVLTYEAKQFLDTGQLESAEKVIFHYRCIEREISAVFAGYDTYVYRDDIETYLERVSKAVVKIIDLGHFERKIPENSAKLIKEAKQYFDEIYIVFTDYTGKEERKVKKKDRANDPIAFGCFKSKNNKIWNHRFYYITDWIDEYCDLTLDRFVSEMITAEHEPLHSLKDISIAEIEETIKKAKVAIKDDTIDYRDIVLSMPRREE